MADDPPPAGPASPPPPRSGWPYQPAEHRDDAAPGPAQDLRSQRPPAVAEPAAAPVAAPPASPRWPLVVAAAVALLVVSVAALVVWRGSQDQQGPAEGGAAPTSSSGSGVAPTRRMPGGPTTDLVLLGGRVVVAGRPGWTTLDSTPQTASVRLVLTDPNGRSLLSTMSIVTLSSPGSLDAILAGNGATGFEVAGADGPLRVAAQPGRAARLVIGAVRPRATFLVNVSIFAVDGQPLEVASLRDIATEQLAPALRFP